jgi:ABC-type lipoprotein export system ATPase subunit
MTISLHFDNLTVGWGGRVVDRHLSYSSTFSGERRFFAITGETGVGKSTLLDTLSGLKPPMEGTVEWILAGRPLLWDHTWSYDMRLAIRSFHRSEAAFLLQRGEMIECLSIEENIVSALALRKAGARLSTMRTLARTVIGQMMTPREHREYGVEGMLQCYPRQLSGGQSIRMALVVSMALDPTVLFVDEPTSSADPVTKRRMFAALGQWAVQPGTDRAVVCITHDAHYLEDAAVAFEEYRMLGHVASDDDFGRPYFAPHPSE